MRHLLSVLLLSIVGTTAQAGEPNQQQPDQAQQDQAPQAPTYIEEGIHCIWGIDINPQMFHVRQTNSGNFHVDTFTTDKLVVTKLAFGYTLNIRRSGDVMEYTMRKPDGSILDGSAVPFNLVANMSYHIDHGNRPVGGIYNMSANFACWPEPEVQYEIPVGGGEWAPGYPHP